MHKMSLKTLCFTRLEPVLKNWITSWICKRYAQRLSPPVWTKKIARTQSCPSDFASLYRSILDLQKKNGKVYMETMKDIHDWDLCETDELLEIMHQDGEGVSLMPYYLIEYLDEMLHF
jgi:hypothetical protein